MTSMRPPDPRPARQPGDGWVECRCGGKHWGQFGAAGLLVVRGVTATRPGARPPTATGGLHAGPDAAVVLQHRALWSHHGGTWGLPGGAIGPDETAVEGAVREAAEEVGLPPEAVRPRAAWRLEHPDWSYTTVVAEAVTDFEPTVTDAESLETRWVPLSELASLPLLPAFEASLPELEPLLGRRLMLVVDAANTVGSRPDGWWRDRRAATERLRDELEHLTDSGVAAAELALPGHRWFPDVVLVAEGQARGVAPAAHVRIVDAPGSGDDEIVRQVELLTGGGTARSGGAASFGGGGGAAGTEVVVVTADRELRARAVALGARVAGPSLVR